MIIKWIPNLDSTSKKAIGLRKIVIWKEKKLGIGPQQSSIFL